MSIVDSMSKFASKIGSGDRTFFFGQGKAADVAAALREIADKVETGELLYQSARLGIEIPIEDFVFETFTIIFAPAELKPETKDAAYRTLREGRGFPAAVVEKEKA